MTWEIRPAFYRRIPGLIPRHGGQSGTGTAVSPRTSFFSCQYIPAVFHPHSAIADTAYKLSIWPSP